MNGSYSTVWKTVSLWNALCRNLKRFRGGLVFKGYRLVYHSTLGLRVIKMKKKERSVAGGSDGGYDQADDLQGYLAHRNPPPLGPP